MAETLVEKDICESCGTTVREGSTFCYNCGESLIPEPLPPAILKPPTGTLNGRDHRDAKTLEFHELEPRPVTVPIAPLESPKAPEKLESKRTFPEARRGIRRHEKKTVEVEWVERTPNAARFIIAAVLIALLVAGLISAALYLK